MTSRALMRPLATLITALLLAVAALAMVTPHADAHGRHRRVPALMQRPHGQLRLPIRPGRFHIVGWYTGPYPQGHNGIDFSALRGVPIHAVARGRVVVVDRWWWSYGKHVVIQHRGGQSLYAHMSRILVHRGQHVRRGQIIGRVGNTGHSYGTHLHLTLIKHGHSVNPAPYFW